MRHRLKWQNRIVQVDLLEKNPMTVQFTEGDQSWQVKLGSELSAQKGRLVLDEGTILPYFVSVAGNGFWVTLGGETYLFEKAKTNQGSDDSHRGFEAPMPGKIVQVSVKKGDVVPAGTVLVILEAMKMEHRIDAPCDGTVTEVHVRENQLVDQGVSLLDFQPEESQG